MHSLRRFLAAIEPWYDWGKNATIWRLDQVERDFSDESEGEAYRVELQWLGIHVAFIIGRVPPKVSSDEVADRKRSLAARKAVAHA